MFLALRPALIGLILPLASSAWAQTAPAAPPVVGVIAAEYRPLVESTEINGRIQAREQVDLVARVTAFLNERLFEEGAHVKKGDVLYRLERAPFEAEIAARQAEVAQAQAQLENADVALRRAEELFARNAGTQVAVDNARASQRTAAAQVQLAQAHLQQSQINLGYTEIHAPIDGRIGRTSVTLGNVVGPTSGTLATIVSLDPMYVVFPMSVRRVLELRERYATKGNLDAVQIRLRLADGDMYDEVGKLDFIDIQVTRDTDTIVLRGTIANPLQADGYRDLAHDSFVSVLLESVEPTRVLAVPRSAILIDQQGDYLYVVNAQNVAEQRRVKLGQSTPETATIVEGLKEGERVVVEGIQRVRPNAPVTPTPPSASFRQG